MLTRGPDQILPGEQMHRHGLDARLLLSAKSLTVEHAESFGDQRAGSGDARTARLCTTFLSDSDFHALRTESQENRKLISAGNPCPDPNRHGRLDPQRINEKPFTVEDRAATMYSRSSAVDGEERTGFGHRPMNIVNDGKVTTNCGCSARTRSLRH